MKILKEHAFEIISVIAIVLVLAIVFMFVLSNDSADDLKEYIDNDLYWNWIDYPSNAKLNDKLFADEDTNLKVLEWFGYNSDLTPNEELYADIAYSVNADYISTKDYVGIPFYNDEGNLDYKLLYRKRGKFSGYKETIW
jgi:hypothetical protein